MAWATRRICGTPFYTSLPGIPRYQVNGGMALHDAWLMAIMISCS